MLAFVLSTMLAATPAQLPNPVSIARHDGGHGSAACAQKTTGFKVAGEGTYNRSADDPSRNPGAPSFKVAGEGTYNRSADDPSRNPGAPRFKVAAEGTYNRSADDPSRNPCAPGNCSSCKKG